MINKIQDIVISQDTSPSMQKTERCSTPPNDFSRAATPESFHENFGYKPADSDFDSDLDMGSNTDPDYVSAGKGAPARYQMQLLSNRILHWDEPDQLFPTYDLAFDLSHFSNQVRNNRSPTVIWTNS